MNRSFFVLIKMNYRLMKVSNGLIYMKVFNANYIVDKWLII